MIKFIKESIRDFNHVVWPTNKETKKYFWMVLTVLILFWIYLFIANTIFSESLLKVKKVLNNTENSQIDTSDIDVSWVTIEWEDWVIKNLEIDWLETEVLSDSEEIMEVIETTEETNEGETK